MKKKRNMWIILLLLLIFLTNTSLADYTTTIYSPEGRPIANILVYDEASPSQISDWNSQTDYWITYYQLTAVRIGNSSRTYNCHGYAWVKSEDMGIYWVNSSPRNQYINDQSWSNDGQASYLSASESQATQSYYTTADHSVRKIQNYYPVPITGGMDYVSKWGSAGLVQHAKHHDVYAYKGDPGDNFRILKTNHTGTLSSYPKIWIGSGGKTHSLTGDVTVPSTASLTIKYWATVNLNGYSIISSNGAITIESGAVVNGALLKTGNTINRIYPTIQSALSAAVSGQTVEVTGGTHTLSSNLSVQSGVTLKLKSGSSINLNGFYIVTTSGTITVDGSGVSIFCIYLTQYGLIKGLFPTIQSTINYSSSNQTVQLSSQTYNESITVTNKTNLNIIGCGTNNSIINGSVSFNSSQGCFLQSLQVNSNVSVNYGSGYNYLQYLNVQGWIAPNMGSTTSLSDATMTTSNYYGIVGGYCTVSATRLQIKHKTTGGVSASAMNMTCSDVTLCNNSLWDITNNGGSNNIYLGNCLFSSPNEGSTINSSGVTWNYWTFCGMSKGVVDPNNVLSNEIKELPSDLEGLSEEKKLAGKEDYEKAIKDYWVGFDKISKENEGKAIDFKQYEKDMENSISEFEEIIQKYPGSVSSVQSLQQVIGCYRLLQEQQSAKQIVSNLLADKTYQQVYSHIRLLSIPLLIDDQNYDGALSLCDTVIGEIPNNSEAALLLYNKGIIFETLKNDKANADSMYSQLLKQYPGSMYAVLASRSLEKVTIPQKPTPSQKIESFEITSYPNPFNPTTTINYKLPVAGRVSLTVYDMLGREVATLVDGMKDAGYYIATFDARNLASGIYFARFTVTDEIKKSIYSQSIKLQLMK